MSKDPTFTATNTIVYNGVGGRGEGRGGEEGGECLWVVHYSYLPKEGAGPLSRASISMRICYCKSKVFKGIAY